jgi:hypothetical protein
MMPTDQSGCILYKIRGEQQQQPDSPIPLLWRHLHGVAQLEPTFYQVRPIQGRPSSDKDKNQDNQNQQARSPADAVWGSVMTAR